MAAAFGNGSAGITCELAVMGIIFGEAGSMLFNIVSLSVMKKPFPTKKHCKKTPVIAPLTTYMIPLTSNHLVVSLLNSLEAILIPAMLRKYGLTGSEALSIYGILTGMSIPFILFPSTVTNSLAVLLLPAISEASSEKDQRTINQTTQTCIKYCMIIGIFSTGIFILFGQSLGEFFFHNALAGRFLVILGWLCPFMYIATTLGSIINGLGKTHLTFINTVTGLGIRILFVFYMVPDKGIYGYLVGLLVSELAIAFLNYLSLRNAVHIELDAINWLVKPALIMLLSGTLLQKTYIYILNLALFPNMVTLIFFCLITLGLYIPFLFISKSITMEDFK
jgi:stage V sporulation protein B